jgi:hypothetical protein
MRISASAGDSGVWWASSECRKDSDDEQLNGQDVVHVCDSCGGDGRRCLAAVAQVRGVETQRAGRHQARAPCSAEL